MNKILGIVITLSTSLIFIYIFFGEPLKNPNSTYFASGGDGFKDYFTTIYFIKYDTSCWHSQSMNYPHGEHVFFTGNQLFISYTGRFISTNIIDISDHMVAFMNLFMLFSLVLGSLLLYLLLRHFKLPVIYSVLAAAGISLLSPQIARLPGHFSLSYLYVIPAILLFIASFHEKPAYWKSILMGLFCIWAFGTHIYMLGFYSMIVVLYWIFSWIFKCNNLNLRNGLIHFSLQFFLPLLLFLVIKGLTDSISDRPSYPWGFLQYTAWPQSVLLPVGRPYARFLYRFSSFDFIEWEGYAFVGTAASVGFLVIIFNFIKILIQRKKLHLFSSGEHRILLNIFLVISLTGLIYSFGWPFKWGLHQLVDYLGPLRQMRGIARFSWIFFYVINIYVFYLIWNLKETRISRYLWMSLVVLSLGVLWYDGLYNINFWSRYVNNKMPVLSRNEGDSLKWEKIIKEGNFQAILPIPYFHIGSENIWIEPQDDIDVTNYIVSWKTGLPGMGVNMSRTSLKQTIMSNQLCWEAYRKPEILSLLNADRDILVLTKESNTAITGSQSAIIEKSHLIYDSEEFRLYSLSIDSLQSITDDLYRKHHDEYSRKLLFDHGSYQSDSEDQYFLVDALEQKDNDVFYINRGSIKERFKNRRWFEITDIPFSGNTDEYVFSFWINDIYTDLLLRSDLIVELSDSGNNVYDYRSHGLFRHIKTVDEEWALIELGLNIHQPGNKIKFRLSNRILRNNFYIIDHVMIRPENINVYEHTDDYLMKNNRFYLKQ